MKENGDFPISYKVKTDPEPRKGEDYCVYQKSNGYKTDECQVLVGIIQRIIRSGHLKKFVKDSQKAENGNQRLPNNAANLAEGDIQLDFIPSLNRIDVIHGRPHLAGNSKETRSRYVREAREGIFFIQKEPLLKNMRFQIQMHNLTITLQQLRGFITRIMTHSLMITEKYELSVVTKILKCCQRNFSSIHLTK